jgi:hypothetical protein
VHDDCFRKKSEAFPIAADLIAHFLGIGLVGSYAPISCGSFRGKRTNGYFYANRGVLPDGRHNILSESAVCKKLYTEPASIQAFDASYVSIKMEA